jgi:hypothetical protein
MISLQPSETIPTKNQALNLTKMETKSKTWKKTILGLSGQCHLYFDLLSHHEIIRLNYAII